MGSPSEFTGKRVIVTGAAQGIGKELCTLLSQQSAIVIALDIQFKTTSIQADKSTHQFALDVRDPAAVNIIINTIERELGPIDYLVNAAGILCLNSLLETTPQQWHDTFNVNVFGAFNMCQAVSRYMARRNTGSIVAISSNAAHTPRLQMGAYSASKAALTQMMKCWGLELSAHNIRCNIVSPGSTDTPMQQRLWSEGSNEQKIIHGSLAHYRLGIPLKRIATPNAIAQSVCFLLSHNSSHITMHDLIVDGGATLGR